MERLGYSSLKAGLLSKVKNVISQACMVLALLFVAPTLSLALNVDNIGGASFSLGSSTTVLSRSSNLVQTPIALPSSASLALSFDPYTLQDGYSTVATIRITNTGGNPLVNGVLTLSQPANTVLSVTDVYGAYTALVVVGATSWQVTLTQPLAVGASIDVYAGVAVPFGTTQADVTMNADFVVVSMPTAVTSATLSIFNVRTPALIEFLHYDVATDTYSQAEAYRAGALISMRVTDPDQNSDPYTVANVGFVEVTLIDSVSGDMIKFTLTETGKNTGVFLGSVWSIRSNLDLPTDGKLSVSADSIMSARYVDLFDNTDTAASAALVDPFGVVFDSVSGAPIDGVTVRIINVATGGLAAVFGDDGVSSYPSTLVTGGTATDAGGAVYNFASGKYRFPFLAPGDYRLEVTPPSTAYSFPSQATNASMQALAAAPFALVVGSRGETFKLVPGPALNIDIPLDAKGVNLFVQKTTSTPVAGIGDRIQYQITVENVHPSADSSVTNIQDVLPLGLRYVTGSTRLNNVVVADPVIQPNGRNLNFPVGIVTAGSTSTLSYTAIVGANTKLGNIVNIAFSSGTMAGTTVQSNTSSATTKIREDLIRSRGFIVGTVFIDDDFDDIQDDGELGVAGIRIFMEDGRSALTDQDGRYHFNGLLPGLHVLQMDKVTIAERYEAVGLKQTRFAENDYSQFADVRGGGLHRANFRLVHRAPDFTPVTVKHALVKEDGVVWANIDFIQRGDVALKDYRGIYILPTGWAYVVGSAMLDGQPVEPEQLLTGFEWNLDADKTTQRVRLAIRGGGDAGMKQAVAYARFASAGTEGGRTGLASIDVEDILTELSDQRSFTLNLKFATRKDFLSERGLLKLNEMVHSLQGLMIRELVVEGHTDNIKIAKRNQHEFANNIVLSQARAAFVATYLQKQLQLEGDLVSSVGKGELEPIASNATSRGRYKNRRVVLKIRADKVDYDFSSQLAGQFAEAHGKAEASWDEEDTIDLDVASTALNKSKFDWLKETTAEPKWLYPRLHDSPAISATHIYIQHAVDEKVELLLNGERVSMLNFEGVEETEDKSAALSAWRGVDIAEGSNHFVAVITNAQGETVEVVKRDVYYASPPVKAILFADGEKLVADGKTVPNIAIQLFDHSGNTVRPGIIGEYTIDYPYQTLEDYQQSKLPGYRASASHFKTTEQGVALLPLLPTSQPGEVRVHLRLSEGEEVVKAWIQPAMRDWILVGFGEGTLGFNKLQGAVQPITNASEQENLYADGRVAFYAKGKLKGDFLLTLAYDTQANTNDGNSRHFGTIDPNVMYTVYGDTSRQEFDASSQEKLYLKIEKETFYALFGDYNTDLSVTEFSRYNRVLTGVKMELHDASLGFSAFAAQTSQTLVRDDLRGNGTSGLYRLSRSSILENTEHIRIETMDRFKSEVVLESRVLTRHLDYDIDYLLGTIWFKYPVMSKDVRLNPVMIRVEYESNDLTDNFTVAGGRVYVKPDENMEVGGTFVSEGRLGTSNTLSGVDVKVDLGSGVEIRAEAASSVNSDVAASAWKVESRLNTEALTAKAYLRQQDDNFGLGQQPSSENSTLKVGADGQWRLDQGEYIHGELFRQSMTNTGSTRDMAFVQYNKQIETYQFRGGLRSNRDEDGAGTVTSSELASLGATSQLTDSFSVRADHEEALSSNNGVDFPTRSGLGADYRITPTTTLSATQEWTSGQFQDTTSSRLGLNTQPWYGAKMSASYEEQLGEGGQRSFANAGLLQAWRITEALSLSFGLDQTTVLSKGATPVPLNLSAPVATGGEDFTSYSTGLSYRPGNWVWTNRLERRISSLSTHNGVSAGVQGALFDDLATQFTLRWQQDLLTTGTRSLLSDASARLAWRTNYDQLVLLNRFDIRRNEQTGGVSNSESTRFINNMTANWQTTETWQLLMNHGIKLSKETLSGLSYSDISDLLALQLIYDFNPTWDLTMQAAALRVRSLGQIQPNYGLALGHNMFENFWLSLGYNFVGFYDADFAAAEYTREGVFVRFRFKFDQQSLGEMLK